MCVVEAFDEVEDRVASFVVIPERRRVDQFAQSQSQYQTPLIKAQR